MRRTLGLAVLLATLLLSAGVAFAHGGEDEALEKTPARALAQQALALLSQENKAVEAHERIEAALKSEDREGVELALLRRTQRAFDRGDHAAATRLIGEALAPAAEERGAAEGDAMGDGNEGEGAAPGSIDVDPAALEHSPEFEPDRGTAEWLGAAVGAAALALGAALAPAAGLRGRWPRQLHPQQAGSQEAMRRWARCAIACGASKGRCAGSSAWSRKGVTASTCSRRSGPCRVRSTGSRSSCSTARRTGAWPGVQATMRAPASMTSWAPWAGSCGPADPLPSGQPSRRGLG